ncbi:hypothetical protein [Peribacillus deserti]|uniref:YodN n=1 Tax=Peribacillus deserti TaxID=673318 RepID=A0A2N5M2Y4_9BACI|nr:hypothetical protein [Peribacillus deserti]PLT28720.1 hypothetical protein CUU66_17085 [Peribacillus deserti]
MAHEKKPKFKIGDTVVINIYGTVGKITDFKLMDGAYVYEVNHSEGLYLESSLEHISDYQGEIVTESEQIDIVYKYFFGDLVQVDGYGTDLFKIVGFRTEIWRYKENAWEDVIYELSKITDGEWLEAHEDELSLVADYETADTYIQKLGFLYPISKKTNKVELNKPPAVTKKSEKEWLDWKKEKALLIDGLLDLYNDYHSLYLSFKDEEYKKVMQLVLKKIQSVADEMYKKT